MRVLVVSQYYPPEPVPIPAEIARDLQQRGHTVRVLTAFPNYPSGRVHEGFSQRWRHRDRDGAIDVLRVPLWADHSRSPVRRLGNYVSFALTSATARRHARGADVIYVYATQMTAALGPWLWSFRGGAPYVLHVQDLWPDSIIGSSMVAEGRAGRWVQRLLSPWLTNVYARAAGVVAIAPTMVHTLVDRGVQPEAAHLVYNWADPGRSPEGAEAGAAGVTVVYAGNVGEMQDLETVVRAAHAAADSGITVRIIGDGVARAGLRRLVDELGCTNVDFVDPVPREAMAAEYAAAHYGLVSLKDLPVFRGTIPSKFQSVLAHGLPVIATVQGDVRRMVEDQQLGFTADAESVGSLADAFRRAAELGNGERENLAARARAAYDQQFSRDSGVSRLESILQDAAMPSGGIR